MRVYGADFRCMGLVTCRAFGFFGEEFWNLGFRVSGSLGILGLRRGMVVCVTCGSFACVVRL